MLHFLQLNVASMKPQNIFHVSYKEARFLAHSSFRGFHAGINSNNASSNVSHTWGSQWRSMARARLDQIHQEQHLTDWAAPGLDLTRTSLTGFHTKSWSNYSLSKN